MRTRRGMEIAASLRNGLVSVPMPGSVAGAAFGRVAAYALEATEARGLLLGYAVFDQAAPSARSPRDEAGEQDGAALHPLGRVARRSPGQRCVCFPPSHHRLPHGSGVELIFLGSTTTAGAAAAALSAFNHENHQHSSATSRRRLSISDLFSAATGAAPSRDAGPAAAWDGPFLGSYPGWGAGMRPITLICSSPPQALPFVSLLRAPWLVGTNAEHPVRRHRPSSQLASLASSSPSHSLRST